MKLEISNMYCTCCQKKGIPIPRSRRSKEPGHLKKIFCLTCQKETNHAEISENSKYTLEDFYFEFEHGNFDEEGNRYDPSYRHFKALVRGDVNE